MKIGIIQATSQKENNDLLYQIVCDVTKDMGFKVTNFGIFLEEVENYSYVEVALQGALLLASNAVDYIITGCSSGQGMMLACNALPGVICGYTPTATDAYLFGRINDGNAISIPLGMGFVWAGEIQLRNIITSLFSGPFGIGYPNSDSKRKIEDALLVKEYYQISRKNIIQVLSEVEENLLNKTLNRKIVIDHIFENSNDQELISFLKQGCRKG